MASACSREGEEEQSKKRVLYRYDCGNMEGMKLWLWDISHASFFVYMLCWAATADQQWKDDFPVKQAGGRHSLKLLSGLPKFLKGRSWTRIWQRCLWHRHQIISVQRTKKISFLHHAQVTGSNSLSSTHNSGLGVLCLGGKAGPGIWR